MEELKKKIIAIKINVKLILYKNSTFILFIISYIVYYLSLEPCFEGEELCGNNMKWIYKKVFQLILSSQIIFSLSIFLTYSYFDSRAIGKGEKKCYRAFLLYYKSNIKDIMNIY